MVSCPAVILLLVLSTAVHAQTYSATYTPGNLPDKSQDGQTGTNKCGTASSPSSTCQNAYINSVDDFCIFGPPSPGPGSEVGSIERIAVAYCVKDGYGTRIIPEGTLKGAHFVQTPDFVQVTGIGDLTKINIPAGDAGGELDPHGADGNGNPVGGLVFSSAFRPLQQLHEWTNFVAADQFCIRACKPGPRATQFCEHIYDIMGCGWNMPANYNAGFEKCVGDSGEPMGIYGASTFHQGDPATPPPHPVPASSSCTTYSTVNAAKATSTTSPGPSTNTAATKQGAASGTGTGTASTSTRTSGARAARLVAGWTATLGAVVGCALGMF